MVTCLVWCSLAVIHHSFVSRCRVLLRHIWPSITYKIYSGLHNYFQHLSVATAAFSERQCWKMRRGWHNRACQVLLDVLTCSVIALHKATFYSCVCVCVRSFFHHACELYQISSCTMLRTPKISLVMAHMDILSFTSMFCTHCTNCGVLIHCLFFCFVCGTTGNTFTLEASNSFKLCASGDFEKMCNHNYTGFVKVLEKQQ